MLIRDMEENELCAKCLRMHCINKHTAQLATPEMTCFQASGCATCKLFSVCANPDKDTEVFEISDRLFNGSPIPTCWWKPTCNECLRASHCQNKYAREFKLNLENPTCPSCFGGYHSTK